MMEVCRRSYMYRGSSVCDVAGGVVLGMRSWVGGGSGRLGWSCCRRSWSCRRGSCGSCSSSVLWFRRCRVLVVEAVSLCVWMWLVGVADVVGRCRLGVVGEKCVGGWGFLRESMEVIGGAMW